MEKKNVKIYMFCGKARSGKDTSASFIKKHLEDEDLKVINLSFSYYIKDYAKRITSWDGSDETKPRELLQQLGTELIRNKIDNYFFINRMIEDIKVFSYFYDVVTISDCRLKIEIESIRDKFNNVCVINLKRPNYKNELTVKQSNHITEVDLDDYNDYDHEILNDKTLEDLEYKIIEMLREVNS